MTDRVNRFQPIALLLAAALQLDLLIAPMAKADGLPLSGNHLSCPKTTLSLSVDQQKTVKSKYVVNLTKLQQEKLTKDAGYAPRALNIITPKSAQGTCTCFMVNVGLLSDPGTIEIPHYLLASNVTEIDPYAQKPGEKFVWGYIDRSGNWVIRPKYVQAFDFRDHFAKVNVSKYTFDGDYRFLDQHGSFVANKELPKTFRYTTGDFHEGLATCYAARKVGFVDKNGDMRIPAIFHRSADESGFFEGLSAVSLNGRWGFIDKSGKFVIPPEYAEARQFHDGLAAVSVLKNGRVSSWIFIDHRGKQVGPAFDEVEDFNDGVAIVKLQGDGPIKAGLMTPAGKVLRVDAWECNADGEGLTGYVKNGLTGFIDRNGKVQIPAKFVAVGKFSEGLAPVILNDPPNKPPSTVPYYDFTDNEKRLVGYIDHTGKLQIPAQFRIAKCATPFIEDDSCSFKNGLAIVRSQNGKFGCIDKTGRWVIQPRFTELKQFHDGLAAARIPLDTLNRDSKSHLSQDR